MIYIQTQQEQGVKNRFNGCAAIGHRFLGWLTGPILAGRYGLRLIKEDIVPKELDCGWNEFLGFREFTKDYPQHNMEDIKNYKIIDLPRIPFPARYDQFESVMRKYSCASISEDENIILRTQPGQSLEIDWQYFFNNNLREKYDNARQNNPVVSHFNPKLINIACHIRRGDVNQKDCPERWVSTDQYCHLLFWLKNVVGWHNCHLHIYSEGQKEDFKELLSFLDNIYLHLDIHLNEDPMDTFHHLATSDILVNAKSAFSVMASYLHKGPKICLPFGIFFDKFPNNREEIIPVNSEYDFETRRLVNIMDPLYKKIGK